MFCSSSDSDFLGNFLVDAAKVVGDNVEHLNDLIGVLLSDLVGDVVVGLLGLGDGINEVAETEVEELVEVEG